MKKFLLGLFFILMVLFPIVPSWAVGTVTVGDVQTIYVQGNMWRKTITITWVADVAAGTLPSTTIPIIADKLSGWYCYMVETDPGSTAPTIYAVTLKDSHGLDLLGGLLATCSATVTEIFDIGLGIPGFPVVTENLTLDITQSGTPVNSATGTLILTFTAN